MYFVRYVCIYLFLAANTTQKNAICKKISSSKGRTMEYVTLSMLVSMEQQKAQPSQVPEMFDFRFKRNAIHTWYTHIHTSEVQDNYNVFHNLRHIRITITRILWSNVQDSYNPSNKRITSQVHVAKHNWIAHSNLSNAWSCIWCVDLTGTGR